jgi:hypothetical protein
MILSHRVHLRQRINCLTSAEHMKQAGRLGQQSIGLSGGVDPALGLLFGSGLELIRVSFPKNPRKQ